MRQLALLSGSWSGELDGTLGPASGARTYRYVLGDRFLFMTHDRDPTEAGGRTVTPEEWSIFSFDAERRMVVLREFLVEGLVNQYVCEIGEDAVMIACESEATEGSSQTSLELRYEFDDRDQFRETFEIFGADGSVQVHMEGRWQRVAGPG